MVGAGAEGERNKYFTRSEAELVVIFRLDLQPVRNRDEPSRRGPIKRDKGDSSPVRTSECSRLSLAILFPIVPVSRFKEELSNPNFLSSPSTNPGEF